MTDNYLDFKIFLASATSTRSDKIGFNRTDTLKKLVYDTGFDDTVAVSLHLADDTTNYQNVTGNIAYAIVSVAAILDNGADRNYKIYSAPTTDSVVAATEVFDSASITLSASSLWDDITQKLTSWLVPIQNNHFIVIENTSGATPRRLNIDSNEGVLNAVVIEMV